MRIEFKAILYSDPDLNDSPNVNKTVQDLFEIGESWISIELLFLYWLDKCLSAEQSVWQLENRYGKQLIVGDILRAIQGDGKVPVYCQSTQLPVT